MGSALKIRDDLTPLELRRWARVEPYGRAAARAYGIANALEEMPRADAARLAGMDRQTLRDAVVRYNAKGLEGLHDRPKGYSPRRLTADEEAALAAVIIAGPEPERDGVCAWTPGRSVPLAGGAVRQDLPPLEHDPGSTADGIFPPEGAPEPPAKGRRSAGALQKRGLRDILKATVKRRIPTSAYSCGFRMKRASATRAGCVTGGGAGASVPPGRVKSATSGPTSSPPCARTPATTSPW